MHENCPHRVGQDIYSSQQKIDTFINSVQSHFQSNPGAWFHCGRLTPRGMVEGYSGPQSEKTVLDQAGILSDGQVFTFSSGVYLLVGQLAFRKRSPGKYLLERGFLPG
ncbi:hypothetical protein [Paraburkholderia sacchari]|uniref:Uncharacterized protein n=1 Tax=Paraburkholderia sacchari TaxID=159450 RepID=A0A8T6ZBP7_9BURK|nr:hypothetical protein [Paraburkholderia sacchari]NLP62102.1 hypothetical protein [Paraburkholderia sacchari]